MTAAISTIIVNYNAGAYLRTCVDSLLACPLEIDVIVVDNYSVDDSLAALEGLPRVQIIRNESNQGFAAACNIGAQLAVAPYLLFLNPDCYFVPGTLSTLLDALRADALAGMAGGLLINPDGTEQAGGRRAIPTPWRSFVRAFGLSRFADRWPKLFFDFNLHKQLLPDRPIAVEAISGACMLVSREAVEQVGMWDDAYFLHCEDLDWCMRFRQRGWKILFVPAAKVSHALGVCGSSRPMFVEWHKHKGMMRFYRKFFRHQYPSILMVLVAAGVCLRFGVVTIGFLLTRLRRFWESNHG
jgi:GT2 family glycosyltransferase